MISTQPYNIWYISTPERFLKPLIKIKSNHLNPQEVPTAAFHISECIQWFTKMLLLIYGKITPPIYYSHDHHMFGDPCHRCTHVTELVSQVTPFPSPVTPVLSHVGTCDVSHWTCDDFMYTVIFLRWMEILKYGTWRCNMCLAALRTCYTFRCHVSKSPYIIYYLLNIFHDLQK